MLFKKIPIPSRFSKLYEFTKLMEHNSTNITNQWNIIQQSFEGRFQYYWKCHSLCGVQQSANYGVWCMGQIWPVT